jgi:DNA-binding MarR family transcriptional regulator
MKLYLIAIIGVILVLCSVSVIAEEIGLKDLSTNEDITDAICYVKIDAGTTAVFPDCGSIDVELEEGDTSIEIIADNPSTPGIDYLSCVDVSDLSNVVYMPQTATLKGIVKDKLDNVVKKAALKFDCARTCLGLPIDTDEFGSFSVTVIGTGHCKVYANYKDAMGYVSLDLEKGDLQDIEIELDKTVLDIPEKNSYLWFAGIAIVVFILLVLLFKFRPKKRSKRQKVQPEEKKEEKRNSNRSNDILHTLNKKEKQIVEFLMSNNNQTHQSKIRHELSIPRTSLARLVESLQRKKIVSVQKEGKAVRIRLTEWFLGK